MEIKNKFNIGDTVIEETCERFIMFQIEKIYISVVSDKIEIEYEGRSYVERGKKSVYSRRIFEYEALTVNEANIKQRTARKEWWY